MKKLWFLAAVSLAGACGKVSPMNGGDDVQPTSCTIACTTDGDCPSGFSCGDLGLCVQGSDTCSCTAGEFIACDGETALSCNSTANGVAMESCGAAGCNATAERCNECAPDTVACNGDDTAVVTCSADGMVTSSEQCPSGCVEGPTDHHCGRIEPAWLPDACDVEATTAQVTLTGTLDTTSSAACTGGIVQVNSTTFCIVRAANIGIGDLKVSGANAIAFVADDSLMVTGILDVSADAATSGPGPAGNFAGGTIINGSYRGAGGGGFAQTGGTGGGEAGTPGATGGAVSERLTTDRFFGGSRGGASICSDGVFACLNNVDFSGGGGGGGALLIACRGPVSVSGSIDAGGGGGSGGGDHETTVGTMQEQGGGGGGGSGGFVVFQGTQVSITGNTYANGGGGGGACGTDNCRGPAGSDGLRATTGAPGGDPPGNTGGGGLGGSVSSNPAGSAGNGENSFSSAAAGAGGGGGSMGRFVVFTPAGVTPVITPASASPAPVASTTSLTVE